MRTGGESDDEKIVGIDEVNFSPSFAGDCVVAACFLTAQAPRGLLKDSKQSTRAQRIRAFEWLQKNSFYVIEVGTVNQIEKAGVYAARNMAIQRAIAGFLIYVAELRFDPYNWTFVIDGSPIPSVEKFLDRFSVRRVHVEFKVKADQTEKEVSAASMLAKVYVDALFEGWERNWPGYGMNSDHGALSNQHKAKLRESGSTPVHRGELYAQEWWRKFWIRSTKGGKGSRRA